MKHLQVVTMFPICCCDLAGVHLSSSTTQVARTNEIPTIMTTQISHRMTALQKLISTMGLRISHYRRSAQATKTPLSLKLRHLMMTATGLSTLATQFPATLNRRQHFSLDLATVRNWTARSGSLPASLLPLPDPPWQPTRVLLLLLLLVAASEVLAPST